MCGNQDYLIIKPNITKQFREEFGSIFKNDIKNSNFTGLINSGESVQIDDKFKQHLDEAFPLEVNEKVFGNESRSTFFEDAQHHNEEKTNDDNSISNSFIIKKK
jgi:hypothetical protein